jgi:hypothetical protein
MIIHPRISGIAQLGSLRIGDPLPKLLSRIPTLRLPNRSGEGRIRWLLHQDPHEFRELPAPQGSRSITAKEIRAIRVIRNKQAGSCVSAGYAVLANCYLPIAANCWLLISFAAKFLAENQPYHLNRLCPSITIFRAASLSAQPAISVVLPSSAL